MAAEPFVMLAVGALLLQAAWSDFRQLKVPNWISVVIAGLFPLSVYLSGTDWQTAAIDHLGAGALVLAIGFGLFTMGKVGGGGTKLMAAVSVWLGLPMLPSGLFAVAIAGSVLCLAVFSLRRSPLPRWVARRGLKIRALQPGLSAPFAVAIAAGFLWLECYSG